MKYFKLIHWLAALMIAAVLTGCGQSAPTDERAHSHEGEGHGHEEAEATPRGPHDGRLLTDGSFSLELAIFESGVPPEFRAWATDNGKPVNPSEVTLQVRLGRLGGVSETIQFAPRGDFLRGDQEVYEPHSFDVHITANYLGKAHSWEYESYEGRTTISARTLHGRRVSRRRLRARHPD